MVTKGKSQSNEVVPPSDETFDRLYDDAQKRKIKRETVAKNTQDENL